MTPGDILKYCIAQLDRVVEVNCEHDQSTSGICLDGVGSHLESIRGII